uniref:Uncharacterized protein n=1 Tax=Arundo donax TaxID=35708 RepID=A0A0A9E1F0_ARUDO
MVAVPPKSQVPPAALVCCQ